MPMQTHSLSRERDAGNQPAAIDDASDLPPREGIWRSRLCGAIFAIGAVLIVLGIASAWLLYVNHASSTLVTIILALAIGGLGLIAILITLVQRTLLRPLTQLRRWAGHLR